MEPQTERRTYYVQAEEQWEHDYAHTRTTHHRQSLEGDAGLSRAEENLKAFARARQEQDSLARLEPWPFHPSEAVHIVVEYTMESGKAAETFPPSWADKHGEFDESPDVEKVVFVNREGKRFWV
jgi:hypothetical protein